MKRKKKYKAKFSTISILKNKIDKNIFEKNHNKKNKRKGKKQIMWGNTVAVHSVL
jgi:hypothetical protein